MNIKNIKRSRLLIALAVVLPGGYWGAKRLVWPKVKAWRAEKMNKEARDHSDEVARRVPAGRVGDDDDMAGAAIYLASRAGDYVVGSTLIVDGGVTWARG